MKKPMDSFIDWAMDGQTNRRKDKTDQQTRIIECKLSSRLSVHTQLKPARRMLLRITIVEDVKVLFFDMVSTW